MDLLVRRYTAYYRPRLSGGEILRSLGKQQETLLYVGDANGLLATWRRPMGMNLYTGVDLLNGTVRH